MLTLSFPLFAKFWRHCMLSGRTQHHALLRYQNDEIKFSIGIERTTCRFYNYTFVSLRHVTGLIFKLLNYLNAVALLKIHHVFIQSLRIQRHFTFQNWSPIILRIFPVLVVFVYFFVHLKWRHAASASLRACVPTVSSPQINVWCNWLKSPCLINF